MRTLVDEVIAHARYLLTVFLLLSKYHFESVIRYLLCLMVILIGLPRCKSSRELRTQLPAAAPVSGCILRGHLLTVESRPLSENGYGSNFRARVVVGSVQGCGQGVTEIPQEGDTILMSFPEGEADRGSGGDKLRKLRRGNEFSAVAYQQLILDKGVIFRVESYNIK